MMIRKIIKPVWLVSMFFFSFSEPQVQVKVMDSKATKETKALFANLWQLSENHLLLGRQDDLAYGVGWSEEEGRSDIRDISGSNRAVYGGVTGPCYKRAFCNTLVIYGRVST